MLVKYTTLFFVLSILFITKASANEIIYTSPVNDAKYVLPGSNIIIGFESPITFNHGNLRIQLNGSLSGEIAGSIIFARDNKTIIFNPQQNFRINEAIDAKVFLTENGTESLIKEIEFFTPEKQVSPLVRENILKGIIKEEYQTDNGNYFQSAPEHFSESSFHYGLSHTDSLPPTFPGINVLADTNPSEGYLFAANLPANNNYKPYLMILDNSVKPVFYKQMPNTCFDFKMQENGLFTYYLSGFDKYFVMNSGFEVVDSVETQFGYVSDNHELLYLDNGNVVLFSYDPQYVGDGSILPLSVSGNVIAIGVVLQEIDEDKNVIFQWRSWDYFNIADADGINFTSSEIDYAHSNAIEVDFDGNFLISSRNMSEVTKINRRTGEIMWRLGGRNNQFTFVNDTLKFRYQHAIRRTPTGTYTLFDNGNLHNPSFSRAVEYRLDQVNKTAELIWEYKESPSTFSPAMGYVERLENGNTVISWGLSSKTFVEVTPDKQKVLEFDFGSSNRSYRVIRENWNPESSNNGTPGTYVITNNYPNPFNISTTISMSLPAASTVSLKIYNLLGQKIATLLDNVSYNAGSFNVPFDATGLASDVYFYQLTVNGVNYSHKMVLKK